MGWREAWSRGVPRQPVLGASRLNATVRIGEAVWEDCWQARHWHYGMTRDATGAWKGCLGAEPSAVVPASAWPTSLACWQPVQPGGCDPSQLCRAVTCSQADTRPRPPPKGAPHAHPGRDHRRRHRVDTHRDTLAAAAVSPVGGILAQAATRADAAGYQQLLEFADIHVAGDRALRTTAQRIQVLHAEIDELTTALDTLAGSIAPWLVELPGVGPVTAAQVLVSWSYAGRLRSEAAFASLAGTSPIPASSGQVTRHRLNRPGDRQRNRALHTIVLARLRDDPETRADAARRTTQGKTPREIRRCRKRFIARQLRKLLEHCEQPGVEVLRTA